MMASRIFGGLSSLRLGRNFGWADTGWLPYGQTQKLVVKYPDFGKLNTSIFSHGFFNFFMEKLFFWGPKQHTDRNTVSNHQLRRCEAENCQNLRLLGGYHTTNMVHTFPRNGKLFDHAIEHDNPWDPCMVLFTYIYHRNQSNVGITIQTWILWVILDGLFYNCMSCGCMWSSMNNKWLVAPRFGGNCCISKIFLLR